MRNTDYTFYVKELRSNECQCGRAKKPGFSFCWFCYSALPFDVKRRIAKPLFRGYEEAYEEAVLFLTEAGNAIASSSLEARRDRW